MKNCPGKIFISRYEEIRNDLKVFERNKKR